MLIIAVLTALHSLLQGAHHVRVVGVIFAAVNVLQQTALSQRLARQPGAFRQIQQILLEIVEAGAADAADHALEAEIGDIAMQTDRFEQLRAAVGGDGRDPHLGHDLIQTFVDTVAIVQHHRTVRFIDGFAVDQLRQRFIGEVRIDSCRAEAQQHGEVVRIAGAGGFNDDVGIAAQTFIDQTGLDRANGHRRRHRQAVFGDVAVGEDQQHGTIAYHLLRFVAQGLHRLAEGSLCRVEGDVEDVGTIVLFFHRRQLFEIGVQQDRRFEAQTMRLAFRFAEDVHFATDAGGQRHDVRFTQRIDRRVRHLGELLTEVIVDNARLAGKDGKRRVIAHRADRLLAIFAEHAQHRVQLFRAVVKLFLVAGQQIVVQLAAANLFVRQIFKRHQATNVFLHPLFIRMAALQIVIGFRRVQNASGTGIDNHQLARAHAAFFNHFVRLVVPDADFRGAGDELIFGNDVARRAQAITVEVTGRVATVGHDDARRAVPWLHMHGVKVEERTQLRIHIRVVLPGWRHQQTHGAHDVHPAGQQQLQHVVH
ncbi:hypothetical protein SB00610_01089 [Klebsiella quasipneumoniae subsp. similipneumoniae]|nr:hypothetical protein SB00610_01089 [Klebsiella quasipneumoniae subsp. similipneumoniae]